MRRPAATMLVWAALLLGAAVVLWAVFEEVDWLSVLLPAFAVGATVALALLGRWAARREARRAFSVEPSPDLSWSTVVVALGFAGALLGLEVGTFLVLIGAGLFALGVGGLVREWRAERRV